MYLTRTYCEELKKAILSLKKTLYQYVIANEH